jgi:rhodanese-related sulfurtransferase
MVEHVSPERANELMVAGDVEVIDVREPSEWAGGHLAGAKLIPLGRLRAAPKAQLVRDGVIFVCAAGVRSETAARLAAALGLARVYNLRGGTRAWTKAGFPLHQELQAACG